MSFRVTLSAPYVGGDLELEPVSLTLTASLASPARSMEGVFALPDFPPECLGVRVERNGRVFFEGGLDEQRAKLSHRGITLEAEARDRGAALLDNEARPKAYQNLTVSRLFRELLAPHDFLLVDAHPTVIVPAFTIRKGQSLWEAFCTLIRLSYGLLPYVDGDMVIAGPPPGGETWVLGGPQHPFSSLTHTISHYEVLSRVYIRDAAGDYPGAVENPDAAGRGISRTRYYIPASEYACKPVWDANQRIRRSMGEMERVALELPGILEISPGESVWVNHKVASLPNLMVEQVTHSLGAAGEKTDLILRSSLYQ